MKPPSDIPILRTASGEVVPGNPLPEVVLSSARSNWHNLFVEEHHIAGFEWNDVKYIQPVVGMNLGRPTTSEFKKQGRFRRIYHQTGSISLFPGHEPLFGRMKKRKKGLVDGLFIALDPVFFKQTAAALEVDPDRVELVGQQGRIDPTLRHIGMALRDGLRGGRGGDAMYGEALSTALAVHLLREYGGIAVRPERAHAGLSREKLMCAIEYIQNELDKDLKVSAIANAVHMSPFHFTRLFKRSTGQTPYRFVIRARANKAKELLTSGKFSIIEIAHRLGFADQSHLTRHLKRIFGVTPKLLLEG